MQRSSYRRREFFIDTSRAAAVEYRTSATPASLAAHLSFFYLPSAPFLPLTWPPFFATEAREKVGGGSFKVTRDEANPA